MDNYLYLNFYFYRQRSYKVFKQLLKAFHYLCNPNFGTMDGYTIKLAQFEGPFDLLLFFIERDELDIHDIDISKITEDFLGYIRAMESFNIDVASEFILVAATLMRIKAKMLLPRKAIDEEGNEIDPRDELVQRLLEYKRYKSILDDMRSMEEHRSLKEGRGNISKELKQLSTKALVDAELESLTMFKLLKTFEKVMARFEEKGKKAVHRVYRYRHTISGQRTYIYSLLKEGQRTDFVGVFGKCEDRMHAIVTFLALLEMLNRQEMKVTQGIGLNNFWIEPLDPSDVVAEDIDWESEEEE